jgi:hypothetical protein
MKDFPLTNYKGKLFDYHKKVFLVPSSVQNASMFYNSQNSTFSKNTGNQSYLRNFPDERKAKILRILK